MPGRIAAFTIVVAVQVSLLMALATFLSGLELGSLRDTALETIWLAFALGILWPFLFSVSRWVKPWLFPILFLLLAGTAVETVGSVFRGISIDGFGTALVVAAALTVGSTLATVIFSINDDGEYDRYVTRALERDNDRRIVTNRPATIFLEIDGLAEPILREAMAAGYAPTLRRWLDSGSHRLVEWEPDLSSQTSASQAGILLGSNEDIPAFRWFDKAAGRVMTSSRFDVAMAVEQRLSTKQGLLIADGASRTNMFSGDAPDSQVTYSTFRRGGGRGTTSYLFYFANIYSVVRMVTLFIADVIRELWQAWRQRRRNEQPRIHRGGSYPFARAATTTVLQELAVFMLVRDLLRGVESVYTTFFAYDEVAHHSGIRSTDALKVLKKLDHEIGRLERISVRAPRPVRFVVLSDHGQSQGPTFADKFGVSLEQLVQELISDDFNVVGGFGSDEGWAHFSLVLSDAIRHDSRTARLMRRALESRTDDREVRVGPEAEKGHELESRPARSNEVIVLGSGNLGLISFPGWSERMTYEEIVDAFPELLPGLVRHPGVGFVMVRSASDGALAIGADGIRYLDHGYAVGIDPLPAYGERAEAHLRRTDRFSNAADIMVMGAFNPQTEEVYALEEKLGSHGGLGGPQTRPFLLYPSELPPPELPIVGAEALHRVLKAWLPGAGGDGTKIADISRG
jgi:hypothetical protein